jgi:hypothetical protein
MNRFDTETGMMDLSTSGENLCQQQRVFTAGEPYKYPVIILYEVKSSHRP